MPWMQWMPPVESEPLASPVGCAGARNAPGSECGGAPNAYSAAGIEIRGPVITVPCGGFITVEGLNVSKPVVLVGSITCPKSLEDLLRAWQGRGGIKIDRAPDRGLRSSELTSNKMAAFSAHVNNQSGSAAWGRNFAVETS